MRAGGDLCFAHLREGACQWSDRRPFETNMFAVSGRRVEHGRQLDDYGPETNPHPAGVSGIHSVQNKNIHI